jgi:hypothetical protein
LKYLALAIVLALSTLGVSNAQESDRSRLRSDDAVPASVSSSPTVERQERVSVPAPPATAAPIPPPAPYNVEDPRAVIDWLLNRSPVRGR